MSARIRARCGRVRVRLHANRADPGEYRVAFAAAGVLMLLPHQASELMLWLNISGFAAAVALVGYEMHWRKAYSGNAILP